MRLLTIVAKRTVHSLTIFTIDCSATADVCETCYLPSQAMVLGVPKLTNIAVSTGTAPGSFAISLSAEICSKSALFLKDI